MHLLGGPLSFGCLKRSECLCATTEFHRCSALKVPLTDSQRGGVNFSF
jgi:hypothetical protein